MPQARNAAILTAGLATVLAIAEPAVAQKSGGILRSYNSSNPPSASILEEATIATAMAFSGIFNNLVIFDQSKPRNGLDTIVPELAESWAWDASRTRLTFKLRDGVKWHDGKPFTAKDVQCTWDKIKGKHADELRNNPRGVWWSNLKEVTTNGELEATFVLARPQASFPALLASSLSPVYPCHVPAKDMRIKPIGTGPFKLVSFESNRSIKLTKNTDYWKPGRPYLDGVEFSIIGNRSTRMLAFVANEFDLTFVADITVPLIGESRRGAPKAICQLVPTGVSTNLLVNRNKPPFDNAKLRKAMALALDRQGDDRHLERRQVDHCRRYDAVAGGRWGMPKEMMMALPGYGGDQVARQAEARGIMESLGYGPAQAVQGQGVDARLPELQGPGGAARRPAQSHLLRRRAGDHRVRRLVWPHHATGLCGRSQSDGVGRRRPGRHAGGRLRLQFRPQLHEVLQPAGRQAAAEQSQEADIAKRKQIVWQIEQILAEDVARPIIMHNRAATCWHPHVKGHVLHENAIYNNWRFESVWLDK